MPSLALALNLTFAEVAGPLVAFVLLGCNSSHLPKERPSDFAFEYRHMAERAINWKKLACDARECTCELKGAEVISSQKSPVTPAQLDAAYASVRSNGFDRLRTQKAEPTQDGSQYAVTLTIAGTRYEATSESVLGDDSKRLNAVATDLASLQMSLCGTMGRR